MSRQAFIAFALMAWAQAAVAEAPPVTERNGVPVIPAVKVNPAPVIDGVLDDATWKETPSVSGFWCTDLNKEPAEPTTMWLGYDERNLYFAFYCKDSQPDKIVAVETKRNGSFRRDDHIVLYLDPAHRHDWEGSFEFMVNARGTQGENIPGGSAYKVEWRGDWQAAARIVEDGYIVEMAIPIAILRYPAGQDTFGLHVDRRHARTLERSTYPKMAGDFDRTKTADWTGFQLPTIRPPLRFMPYAMMDLGSEGGSKPRIGFDLKQTFPSGLTAMFSAKPDFRNIEGEVLNLDFSYNERLARETRPFFVEGQGFMPSRRLFASQHVANMDAGFKVFGNLGATQLGVLGIYDGDTRRLAAFNVERKLSEYFRVSSAFVGRFDRDSDQSIGQIGATYSRSTPSGTPYVWTNFSSILTGGSDRSYDVGIGFWPANRHLGGWLNYDYVGKNFAPADGFVPERDRARISGGLTYERKMPTGAVDEMEFDVEFGRARHVDGSFFHNSAEMNLFVGFRNGTGVSLSPFFGNRQEGDTLFRDRVLQLQYLWNRFRQYRQGSFGVAFGRQAGGSLFQYGFRQEFRFRENFGMSLSTEFRRGFDEGIQVTERQTILSLNYDFTPERGVGGRLVQRSGGVNWYLAYRQNVRRGMDAFIVLGDPNADRFEPRVALKTVFVY